ncbi:MAG TPA: fibronectin type III domain-containing protein [Patescibacteria group bacterium]|nr:fibronectin type III domain-containing protein [Patescibacteria group bacterium]
MKRLVSVFLAAAILISMFVNYPINVQAAGGNAIAIMADSFNTSNVGDDGENTLLWMKGNSTLDNGQLLLTNNSWQAGSVVKRNQVKLSDGFSTYFQMYFSGNADGIAFILYKSDTPKLGDNGGALGYGDKEFEYYGSDAGILDGTDNSIHDSIIVEFDTWRNYSANEDRYDPNDAGYDNHAAIMLDGNQAHTQQSDNGAAVYKNAGLSGQTINAWVDYISGDGINTTGTLTVTFGTSATKGDAANHTISRTIQVLDNTPIAGDNVFVGFTSSTGGNATTHKLLKWYFKDSYVADGLDPTGDTYTQAPATLSVVPNNAGTNPTNADIIIKDDSGNAMANETFAVNIDDISIPEGTPGDYDTGIGAGYSFTIPSNLSNGSHTIRVVGEGGVTNFATFTVDKHIVTYNGNGNTGGTVPLASSHNDGTTVTVSANSGLLVNAGYDFAGWNIQADGSGTTYHAGSGQIANISSDITLYAIWSKFSASEGNSLFITSGDAVVIDPNITIEGFTESISGAKVMIQNKKEGDTLSYTNADGITGTYDSTTGVLTLEGNATPAQYQTILRSIKFSTISNDTNDRTVLFSLGGGLYYSGTDHFYEFVSYEPASNKWEDAVNAASARSFYGRQGYLVTITSAEENAFVTEKIEGLGWIGAKDINNGANPDNGDWRWVTGPEGLADGGNGTQFYTGYYGASGTTVTYSNWSSGEPNNGGNIEYVAHIFGPQDTIPVWAGSAQPGQWNDFPDTINDGAVKGYVVEYGGMAGDTPIDVKVFRTIDIELAQPGTLAFSSVTYSVAEDGTSVIITVDRTGGSDGSVSADYATSDDTATAGSDYTAVNGTLIFEDGETSKTFTINITDDAVYEGVETVNLTLSNVTGGAALGAQSTVELTITDNEVAQPSAPTIESAVAGDGHVNITWSEVEGSTGYKIFSSITSGSYEEPLATVSGAVYSYDATSLTNGITYYFAVKATNEGGDSEYSNEMSATPQVPIPGAPELYSPVAGNAQVSLSWSPAEGSTEYTVFSSTTSDSYGSELDTVAGSVYSYDATGLTNGITYYFRVKAANPGGSVYSNQVSATPKTAPGAPSNVTATAGNGQATVSFTTPADNGGSSITSYTVLVYQNGNLQGGLSTTGAGSPITVSGLTNGTTYTFKVAATNAAGDSAESEPSGVVTPMTLPGVPTNVTATAGNGQATVSFTVPVDNGGSAITSYIVTSDPGNITATGTGTSITVTGLANGTTYTFIVKAVNAAGPGTDSAASNAVTPYRPSGGGDSSNDNDDNSSNTNNNSTNNNSTPTEQSTVIVIVNGEEQNAGKETITAEDGKSTVTVEVINKVIESKIDEAIKNNTTGLDNVIQVPVADTKSDTVKVELTGDIVKKLEEYTFDVSIKRDNVEYVIPAEEFTISKVAENLGLQEKDLEDIKVVVQITKLDETIVEKYNEVAKANGAELVFPPVEFEIVAKTTKTNGTTDEVEISKFSNYVERVMEIPTGVEPNKITTGIVFNPDGTYSHVPTEVFQKDGKWYVKLNSLTNSNYSVIWNPIIVASVENHWAKDAVNDMASRLVIFNPEKFEPNKAITRADFAEYIVRALGLYREDSTHENKFKDVSITGDRTLAILIANEYGIVTGYANGTFKPDNLITREEAMTMYSRAMKITKLIGTDKERYLSYTDYEMTGSWAQAYVNEVLSAHVFSGTTATAISPKSNLTYAEAAQAIKNLLVESKLINK